MDESKLPPPVTLRDILRILRRRLLLAIVTFAVVVGTTLYCTAQMPTVYEAKARILLETPASNINPSGIMDLVAGNTSSPLDTEIEKIKARGFLQQIIDRLGLKGENTDSLKGQLTVATSGGGQILDIGVRAKTPARAKKLADTVASQYLDLVEDEYLRKTNLSERRLMQAEKEALKEKQEAEQALNAFTAKVGTSDPLSYYRDRAAQTLTVRNELDSARRSLGLQRQNLQDLQDQLGRIPKEVITGYTLVKNPVIDGYRADLAALQVEREKLLFDYAPDSDEVKAKDKEIEAKKAAIVAAEKAEFSPGSRGVSRNGDYSKVQSAIHDATLGIKSTQHNIAVLEKRYAQLETEQKALTLQQSLYEGLKHKRDTANDVYEQTRAGLIRMSTTRVMSAPNLRLLEDAKLPDSPISPKPLLNLAMALCLGMFLGIGSALFAEYMASGRMVEEPITDLPMVGGVPLLGALPLSLPGPAAANPDGLPSTMRYSSRAVDTLREIGFTLAHRHAGDPVPVILLSGTRSDNASAAFAAQLTATLVRDGLRVTLVDADRAQPRLNQIFGAPDAPGLADVLAGRAKTSRILHVGANGNLRFLAAGSPEDSVPMTEAGLRRLFKELADQKTDVVVVNGPSVWQAPLIAPLEKAATGMVIVAPYEEQGIAPAESVARARRLLTNGYQPNIRGVILGLPESGSSLTGDNALVLSSGETVA